MRTPAGKDCTFFFGDYHRGRNEEECRLLKSNDLEWTPDLCSNCPLPEIQLANACEYMQFYTQSRAGVVHCGQEAGLYRYLL